MTKLIAPVNLHRCVNNFLMRGQLLAHAIRIQRLVVRDDAESTGIGALADPPDMQVDDAGFPGLRSGFDGFADSFHHWMIHFSIEQHFARFGDQILRPIGHQRRPHDAHRRVQPGPAIKPTAGERDDRQHRGGRIGNDVQVGGLQVEVMMVGMMLVVAIPRVLAVMVRMIVRAAQNQRAHNVISRPTAATAIASR